MIYPWISKFTSHDFKGMIKKGKRYYLADEKRYSQEPVSQGIYLGLEGKEFRPSLALIEMVARHSDRKLYVDDKAEWLFLCGRDLFSTSITKSNVTSGEVLVQNQRDENIGLGKIVAPMDSQGVVVKNLFDRGDFLRRER